MNEYDEIISKKGEYESADKGERLTREEWLLKKEEERTEAYQMLDEGTDRAVSNPEYFRDYLDAQARFGYSVGNSVLVAYQRPDATSLATFDAYKEAGNSVKRGESAIIILEPGNEYTRSDGSKGVNMNVKKVFDISQTENGSTGERHTPDLKSAIKALVISSPCDIIIDDEKAGDNLAIYNAERDTIYIRQGMEGEDIFRVLSQEIAVSCLVAKANIEREDCAFTAYSASYILCEKNGIDNSAYNFDKVAERFEGLESKDIREELGKIREVAMDISKNMDRQFEKMEKSHPEKSGEAR